jgi:hypothetical protein
LSQYLIVPLSASWALTLTACAEESGISAADALRSAFPDQAPLILDRHEALEDGVLRLGPERTDPPVKQRRLSAALPERGDEPIRLRLPDGFEVRVLERGAFGEGVIAGGAVAYAREGGTSFWMTTAAGFEEWLLLEPGRARPNVPVAAWDLEGATARQAGEVIEIAGEDGKVRLHVAAPAAFAEGGRPIRVTLALAGPSRIELYADGGGERVLIDPSWTPTEALIIPRFYAATAQLATGEVLLAGGEGQDLAQPTLAELYDDKTNAWTPAGSIASAIQQHTMTLLPSGKVLLAGGYHIDYVLGKGQLVAGAQLYTPATKAWTSSAPMFTARSNHTATALLDGSVLVTGGTVGAGKTFTSSAELYHPGDGTWKVTAPMATTRSGHVATRLLDGKVLVTGGQVQTGGPFATGAAEIYDPASKTWKSVAPMSQARLQHATLLLADGRVLACGKRYTGEPSDGEVALGDAEIYDPVTNTWKPTAPMAYPAGGVTLTSLANGKALLTHHENSPHKTSAQIYDPVADAWMIAKAPLVAHHVRTATRLPNDKVLLVGGSGGLDAIAPFAEIYDPGAATGLPCATAVECESGFCADGVCCDRACDSGACEACSIKAGALLDGTCAGLTGATCNDGDPCTLADVCEAGACAGAPRHCAALNECHEAGTCDSATGLCSSPPRPDGSSCLDNGVCASGACTQNHSVTSLSGAGPDPELPAAGACGCRLQGSKSDVRSIAGLILAVAAFALRTSRRARAHR